MGDNYTDVTSSGYGQRLGGSIVGMLFGLLFLPISVGLLYWNEGRAVAAIVALDQGQHQIVEIEANPVDQAADGKLVHLSGPVTAASAKDPIFGVTGDGLLRLRRTVEMYQWKENKSTNSQQSIGGTKTTETTYNYRPEWSEQAVDSGQFRHPEGHQNPPMTLRTESFNSSGAKLGAYALSPGVLDKLTDFGSFSPPSSATAPADYHRDGDQFYKGDDSASPKVGDVRVSFADIPLGPVSVVAGLNGDSLGAFSGNSGYTLLMAKPGTVAAAEMFREQQAAESGLTWILRGVGFVIMLIGFLLIARPLSMLLAFLPFLEGIVETGAFLVALTLAIPLTLLTIALAWLAHRPLIGGLLIAGAIIGFVALRRMHARPAAKPA